MTFSFLQGTDIAGIVTKHFKQCMGLFSHLGKMLVMENQKRMPLFNHFYSALVL